MKINIFTYVFWPEQFLINEFTESICQKNDVHVLTGFPNYPKGDFFLGYSPSTGPYQENFSGAKIRRYPIAPRKKGFFRLMINYITHFFGATFTQYYLPKADWAFVFATSPITTAIPAILWAKLNNAKVCVWLQDLWPDSVAAVGATSRKSFLYNFLGYVVRWIYKRTDLMMIQSPGFKSNLQEFGYKGPTYVIPNWAPDLDFENAQTPEWLQKLPNKFTITFAGNIGIAQGIDTVIGAIKKVSHLESLQFVIVGDGSDLERIKQTVLKDNLRNVHFFGRRAITDMPGLFKRSDALLVSLKRDPIFAAVIPSKIQAYMAAGKPIIGSLDGVGNDVILEAGCGLTASAEDIDGLAKAFELLISKSAEERDQMGRNAQSYFYANYRKDTIIGQILNLLEQYR